MGTNSSRDPIFTPELVKILKIFVIASILLVLVLSFFNERRADNTGEARTFKVNSSNRLFFLNLRAINYDREAKVDAKMLLFRHKDRKQDVNSKSLDFVIVLNSSKEEAYIYLEPKEVDWPLKLKARTDDGIKEFILENGNTSTFLAYAQELKPSIDQGAKFSINTTNGWIPIWDQQGEIESLKEVLKDYFNLLNDR
ncbi:hypothetical protein AAGF08_01250 [Algoriphagus sp. SE2]|uniref:hypothetical protein n=1 Tax=Algoriphagus sp. SE2 TaxID=3141536 RepID=UPI0031CD0A1B